MSYPVVLVLSSCSQTSALDVISKIRKLPNEEKTHDNDDGSVLYLYDIDTKYYSTQIAFCPLDSTENLDDVVKNNIEGIVLYIDAKDRSYLDKLPQHVNFMKTHQVEFCMALCEELFDDITSGVTFKCIKDCYNMLDIIELRKPVCDDDEDDDESIFNPSGYDELAQALRSVIWSNVDVNHVSSNGKSQISNVTANNEGNSSDEELNVESELENFENLLNQMMQFRPATNSMSREDRLTAAEGFAEIFEKLILQDGGVNSLEKD